MESDNKYKYYCEYCGRAFERKFNLSRHLQNVHNRHLETVEDEDETESNTSMSESNASSKSESNASAKSTSNTSAESEWETYTQLFENLMLDTYNETACQLFPNDNDNDDNDDDDDDDDDGNDQSEYIMQQAKKAFRNKLKTYLNIVYGMQEDKRYDYLFQKIDRNMEKKIDFPVAIDMAVRSSAAIIDKDFENVISREMEVSTDGEQSGQDVDD